MTARSGAALNSTQNALQKRELTMTEVQARRQIASVMSLAVSNNEATEQLLARALRNDRPLRKIEFNGAQAAEFYALSEPAHNRTSEQIMLPFDSFGLDLLPPVEIETGDTATGQSMIEHMAHIDANPDEVLALLRTSIYRMLVVDDDQAPPGLNIPPVTYVIVLMRVSALTDNAELKTIETLMSFGLDRHNGAIYTSPVRPSYPEKPLSADGPLLTALGPDCISIAPVPPNHSPTPAEAEYRRMAALVEWLCLYMTAAKGISVVPKPVSRQQRRRAARKQHTTDPVTYVIHADPALVPVQPTTGRGTIHSVRYDVRGHWRLRNGKLSWIRPHQRGLANERYVPRNRRFKGERSLDAAPKAAKTQTRTKRE